MYNKAKFVHTKFHITRSKVNRQGHQMPLYCYFCCVAELINYSFYETLSYETQHSREHQEMSRKSTYMSKWGFLKKKVIRGL